MTDPMLCIIEGLKLSVNYNLSITLCFVSSPFIEFSSLLIELGLVERLF